MAAYFLDSSAAVKLNVEERGTPWLMNLADPPHGHDFFLVRISPVEIAAALYGRVRAGTLSVPTAVAGLRQLREDLARTYQFVEPGRRKRHPVTYRASNRAA